MGVCLRRTGPRPIRHVDPLLSPAKAEAALQVLCGMVTHSVLMHGVPPPEEVIDSAVDIVVAGLGGMRPSTTDSDSPAGKELG